jgi:PKD repeat protein
MSGLVGKILRITPSGDIPATNPYQGPGTERCNVNGRATPGNTCQEIFASGLRNPWQIAFDPNDTATRFYINDVGDFRWEEIDVGTAGADYGWNIREGHCARGSLTNCGPPPAGMTNPIYDYLHDYDTGGCSAITGGAFVPAGIWPPAYDGSYLFADFTCGKIARLEPLGGGYSAIDLANQIPLLVSIAFGPSPEGQALYYIRWDSGYYLAGEPGYHIRRIVYTGAANRPPQAGASLKPPASRVPSTVHFSSTGSSDPDGDELSYEWDFDDGSAHSSQAAPDHTYAAAGVYSPKLTVRDGYGHEDSATLTFHAGDDPPAPKINSPSPSKRFRVGERITLRGLATDQEDGTLPDSALRWKVIRHHAAHTHPFLPVTTGNNLEIVAPSPEDIQATTVSKLEIQLTATDSSGVSQTVRQYLLPALVDLSFESDPSGLNLEVAGSTLVTPQTITSWEGWDITATAPEQTDSSGRDWLFEDWSDGGGASHTITTPSSASTYTARFKAFPHPSAAPEVGASLVPVFRQCGTGANPSNGEHSLPLGDDACLPPVGTGTARIGPEAVGSARFEVTPGDLDPGNGNQADVLVTGGMTDVVTQLGADYDPMPLDPDMTLLSRMRITDRSNGASNRDIATTTDLFFPIPVDCAATIDPATGATCSVDTTMNAIAAGAITEGKDAVIQFFRVRLDDAGANGTRGDSDDRIFATQGVYVP